MVLSALILLGVVPWAAFAGRSGCVCTFGQPCWPSAFAFAELQYSVSQPLIYPLPSASACYPPSDPSGNCTEVLENWGDSNWRSSLPGAMEAPNWETFTFANGTIDACYRNTSITGMCGQGSVPIIGVDARSVQDIQAAVTFAVMHNLKMVVKNTGHDVLGRSTARDSFVVWTHNMKNITYDAAFVPQGAPATVTLGAGVQWHEAYDAVNNYSRVLVGGASVGGSVGSAGGWLAGGGHSALSPNYGLGVDNTLEISVVLSTGEFLVTNNHQNSDLFWALRGGGGFTYGIVTSVTYQTYPSVPTQMYSYEATVTNSSAFLELVKGFLHQQGQFTDNGWGGYGSLTDQGSMNFIFIAPNMTNERATATTRAWHNFSASLAPFGVNSADQMQHFPSWYAAYPILGNISGGTGNFMVTNRLLTRDSIETNSTTIAKVMIDCNGSLLTVAGGKVNQIDPDSAGVTPAWRDAVVEALCAVSWDDSASSTEIQGSISQLKGWIQEMYNVTPNNGAYLNEASLFEIDWQDAFFGSHYSDLKSIKDRYDPYRLFVVAEGVGSEEWNKNLTCRY